MLCVCMNVNVDFHLILLARVETVMKNDSKRASQNTFYVSFLLLWLEGARKLKMLLSQIQNNVSPWKLSTKLENTNENPHVCFFAKLKLKVFSIYSI